MAGQDDNNTQDQNVADDITDDETTDDVIEDDETTDDADEGDQNSDDADEGDQNSDEGEDSEDDDKESDDEKNKDKTKEDKLSFAFKKKQAQLKEEKTKRINLEKELAEKTQKLNELTKPVRPVIPDMPDTYDPQYAEKVAVRDETIRAVERHDQQIAHAQARIKENAAKVAVAKQEHVISLKTSFDDRVKTLDLDLAEFEESEKIVAGTLGPEGAQIAEFLLSHKQGPLIVKHLSKNDLDLDQVSNLAPMEAAVYLTTVVVPKLGDLKSSKKISKTPRAPKTLKGRGKVKSKNPYLQGATFE